MIEQLQPGVRVGTILRHVSQSGMSRDISLVMVSPRGEVVDISHQAAELLGKRMSPRGSGIRMGGFGQDMGFALVYALGRALWPNGYACTNDKQCRSNSPHGPSEWHNDGGYALEQYWI